MGIFGDIMGKIFGNKKKAEPAPSDTGNIDFGGNAAPAGGAATAPVAQNVDVGEVLDSMAEMKGDTNLNYRSSIVDLLKLLDLDSSLSARRELAEELNVHAGDHGSAEQNIALHRAVMDKLEENGGIVPASLRD